jgi:Bacterial regulatory protein, Fis family
MVPRLARRYPPGPSGLGPGKVCTVILVASKQRHEPRVDARRVGVADQTEEDLRETRLLDPRADELIAIGTPEGRAYGRRLARGQATVELADEVPGVGVGLLNQDPVHRVLTMAELAQLERKNIQRALALTDGKVSGADGAAARLGVNPSTLSSRLRALGLRKSRRR